VSGDRFEELEARLRLRRIDAETFIAARDGGRYNCGTLGLAPAWHSIEVARWLGIAPDPHEG
jgi:hypothetical protein